MTQLEFTNQDATPKYQAVKCDEASIPLIMQWYGSHYAGDRYSVKADGVALPPPPAMDERA